MPKYTHYWSKCLWPWRFTIGDQTLQPKKKKTGPDVRSTDTCINYGDCRMTTIGWRVSLYVRDVPFNQSDWNYRSLASDPINIKTRLHTDVEFDSMFKL